MDAHSSPLTRHNRSLIIFLAVAALLAVSVIAPGAWTPTLVDSGGSLMSDNQQLLATDLLYWNISTQGRQYGDCWFTVDDVNASDIINYVESSPGANDIPLFFSDDSSVWFNEVGNLYSWPSGGGVSSKLVMLCVFKTWNGTAYTPPGGTGLRNDSVFNVTVEGLIDTSYVASPTDGDNATIGEQDFILSIGGQFEPNNVECYADLRDENDTPLDTTSSFVAATGSYNATSDLVPMLENYATVEGVIVKLYSYCKNVALPNDTYYSDGATTFYLFEECVPNWSCSSFGACNVSNVLPCTAVVDGNACGESFMGNLSDYDDSCVYVAPSEPTDTTAVSLGFVAVLFAALVMGIIVVFLNEAGLMGNEQVKNMVYAASAVLIIIMVVLALTLL